MSSTFTLSYSRSSWKDSARSHARICWALLFCLEAQSRTEAATGLADRWWLGKWMMSRVGPSIQALSPELLIPTHHHHNHHHPLHGQNGAVESSVMCTGLRYPSNVAVTPCAKIVLHNNARCSVCLEKAERLMLPLPERLWCSLPKIPIGAAVNLPPNPR